MKLLATNDGGWNLADKHADDDRPVWIIADDIGSGLDLAASVGATSSASVQQLNFKEALAKLPSRPVGSLVIAAVGHEHDDAVATLALLNDQAHDALMSAMVTFPRPAIDMVAAQMTARHVILLCEPARAEFMGALALGQAGRCSAVHAGDELTEAMKLQRLADEVSRIARALAGLAEPDDAVPAEAFSDGLIGYRAAPAGAGSSGGSRAPVKAEDVRTIIRLRRQREAMFAGDIFSDPAWDMMLDLLAARIERLKVSVSSLCIAAAVPATTALRWIRTLTELGVFVRVSDPTDGRRVFIGLSDASATLVLNLLGEAKAAGVAVV